MRYNDVKTWLTQTLTAMGVSPVPMILPGPWSSATVMDEPVDSFIVAQFGNGAGLDTEELFDNPFITIRVAGPQGDFEAAESLAWGIDSALLRINGNAMMGSAKVLFVVRSGGAPGLIDYDSADRYHFQTTYVVKTQTGL